MTRTYEHEGRTLIDCPRCAQAVAVSLRSRSVGFRCFGGCAEADVLAALAGEANGAAPQESPAVQQIRRELEERAGLNSEQPGEALPFVWASELKADARAARMAVEGYVAPGSLVLLAGKPKAAGKSTLAWALAEAAAVGALGFLGRQVRPCPVVFVSEEAAGTLAHKVPAKAPIRVLTRDVWPRPTWPGLITAASAEAERIGAGLVVIDALSFWAAITEGRTGDAAAMQAVMDALTQATRAGLAVLLIHHTRKSGGEQGDAVRDRTRLSAPAMC